MKTLACLLLLLPSCVAYRGADGTTLLMAGTNADSLTAGSLSMQGVNQSEGTEKITKALINTAIIKAAGGILNTGIQEGAELLK